MTCYPVNEAGEKVEMEVKGKIGMGMLEKWAGYVGPNGEKLDPMKTILPFLICLGCLMLVFFMPWLFKKLKSASVSVPVNQISAGIGGT